MNFLGQGCQKLKHYKRTELTNKCARVCGW